MKYSQLMFHSAERTVAMDVTVPQAAHVNPSSGSAFQFHLLPFARQYEAPSAAVRQPDPNFRTSPRSDSRGEAMFGGSSHYLPPFDPGSPAAIKVTACPDNLNAKHPTSWSKDDVEEWLGWSAREFELDDVQRKRFSMNGKALCILSKEGFRYRAPNAGDLLHELLQKLLGRGITFSQSPTGMQMTPSVSANEEMALMRHLVETTPSTGQRHRRTPTVYKHGEESTRPPYEPNSRYRTSDRNHYKSNDKGGKPNTPELLPLNLKITDNARERYSSSGHSTPHGALDDDSQQSSHPLTAVHRGYPPQLPPYPTVHPKTTVQEPRCGDTAPEPSAHHDDVPAGRDTRRPHCSSPPPGRNSPANHSLNGSLTDRKRNLPLYCTPTLPHRQSHTGAEFAEASEDSNPPRKHRQEMIEAHRSSAEGHKKSIAHPSEDLSYDSRPNLRDILIGAGYHPSSPQSYSQMKGHDNQVRAPVIQTTPVASTNGTTYTGVITNCTANQRSAPISLDSLAHHGEMVPLSPFSHQYPYRPAPSAAAGQPLTYERSPPSVFSNVFDVKILCDPKVEMATSEMDCDAKPGGAGKKKGCRPLLWQFLWLLLKDKSNLHSICWEDEVCLVFRIIDTERVAKLWGKEKNRLNMTYEKMSRGMRYYYNTGILCKEPGQKLTYRFLKAPEVLANSRHFSKNKMKNNAAGDAASKEARIRQEVDTRKPVRSERDAESANEVTSPGSASTTIVASPLRCDIPIAVTTVAKDDIRIKKEHDEFQA